MYVFKEDSELPKKYSKQQKQITRKIKFRSVITAARNYNTSLAKMLGVLTFWIAYFENGSNLSVQNVQTHGRRSGIRRRRSATSYKCMDLETGLVSTS